MTNINKIKKVKSDKIIKKGDIAVYAVLVVCILLFFLIFVPRKAGSGVEIKFKSETIKTVPLAEDAVFTVIIVGSDSKLALVGKGVFDGDRRDEVAQYNSLNPTNPQRVIVIVIEGGFVWVEYSDCRDGLCKGEGKQSKVNGSITCKPLRVILLVTGEEELEPIEDGPIEV